jgi:LPS export ABC transporter permease LptG
VIETPHLTLVAWVGALLGVSILVWRMAALYVSPDSQHIHSALVQVNGELQAFTHEFMGHVLRWGALLFTPALILSLIRSRGPDRLLPIALASLAVWMIWIEADLHAHYVTASVSNLGEEPSLPAYYWKLVVTSAAILSPPLVAWFYLRTTILDRHVLRQFLVPFSLCFFGLIAIFIAFDIYDNGKDFLEARFSGLQIAWFYIILIPKFIVEVIDISLLLAVLYSLGRMSRYNEIISMLGAGRSVVRLLAPLFLIGIFAAILTMACNYQWAPEADRRKSDMLRLAEERDPQRKARKARAGGERVAYMNRTDRRFWYLNEIPIDLSEANKIDQVEIHEHDEKGRLVRSIYAKNALWQPREPPVWIFYNVRIMTHLDDPERIFEDQRLYRWPVETWRETPWQLLSESAKMPAQFLSMPQLASYLNTNREAPDSQLASYRTWWHDRLARPLRCLVVVLFAAPLGIVYSRRGLMGSVASTIILYFAMYFLTSIFIRLGETHKLPAAAAAWSVNILFGSVGAVLLWQRSRHFEFAQVFQRFMIWKRA